MPASPLSIAIIGAGPAGLTLARLLQTAGLSNLRLTIFERDASSTSRASYGGTLDLHHDTGLAALRSAGLWDEFLEDARYDGEELTLADHNDTAYVYMKEIAPQFGDENARPEIDRHALMRLLLKSVDSSLIQWGKGLKEVNGDGTLTFNDGTTQGPYDLVVGADGAWSKVRNALTDVKPVYSGVAGFYASVKEPNERWPRLSKMVGRGNYFASSEGKRFTAQRMGDESIKTAIWLNREESWPATIVKEASGDEKAIKEAIVHEFDEWTPQIKQFISVSEGFTPLPLYELPVGHRWQHRKGFTLIGDSAHLMTPFAGEGVNAAMKDSLELSELLVGCMKHGGDPDTLDEAVRIYEERMYPRAKKVQEQTMKAKVLGTAPGAPAGFLVHMMAEFAEESGWDLNKGWLYWMPVSKLALCYFKSVGFLGALRRTIKEWLGRS